MKKVFAVILSLFIFSGFVFAQDFGSEAEDLVLIENEKSTEAETEEQDLEEVAEQNLEEVAEQKLDEPKEQNLVNKSEVVVEKQDIPVSKNVELATEESKTPKNDFYIGFNLSILGVEPIFQWVHNDHLEMQTGISFIQYPADVFGEGSPLLGIVTPMYDIGYRTNFYVMDMYFSIGGTVAVPIASSNNSWMIANAIAVYLKLSGQIGIFELSGKTYVPLFTGCVSTIDLFPTNATPAFADWQRILQGYLFTTFEVKIHI